jgi:hypothetical protein
MWRIGRVVARKGTNAAGMMLRTLFGKESQVTAAGCLKLAMRPKSSWPKQCFSKVVTQYQYPYKSTGDNQNS